jgi:hypothetical protein
MYSRQGTCMFATLAIIAKLYLRTKAGHDCRDELDVAAAAFRECNESKTPMNMFQARVLAAVVLTVSFAFFFRAPCMGCLLLIGTRKVVSTKLLGQEKIEIRILVVIPIAAACKTC